MRAGTRLRRGAPARAVERLCELEAIPEGGARGFRVATASGVRPLLVWRGGGALRGFWNRCPHRGTTLDWVPDHFMDRAGEHLVCATHGAVFRPLDGRCVAGPCLGERLEPAPVALRDGVVYFAPSDPS